MDSSDFTDIFFHPVGQCDARLDYKINTELINRLGGVLFR